jgi:hypothetical protein
MAKKGSLKHIHIEPMSDGTAHFKAHHEPPMEKGSNGQMPMMGGYDANDESGSGTPEEMGAHVTRILKKHFGKSDNDADDMYAAHPGRKAFGR